MEPILLIIFKRVDQTKRVFEVIRRARPAQLFIAADAYRPDKPGEKELCEQVKEIVSNVDWPCEVLTDYLTENIGPCKRVPSAVSWFFSHVERGIIFEDDCLPDQSFFEFCHELLVTYKDAANVMHISGSNLQNGATRGDASYYFSRYPTAWGWATWRRAWQLYDAKCSQFPVFAQGNKIGVIVPDTNEQKYWLSFFEKIYTGKFIFWDVTWIFSIWNNNGICITPNKNLVQNIGFDASATHTKEDTGFSIPAESVGVLVHPKDILVNQDADRFLYTRVCKVSLYTKIKYKIKQYLS